MTRSNAARAARTETADAEQATTSRSTKVMVPLDHLRLSPLNMRFDGQQLPDVKHADKGLAANIQANGLMVPLLITTENETWSGVVAGGRRLLALRWLAHKKLIPDDKPIECLLQDDDAQLRDVSLSENLQRVEPHPVDAFMQFSQMHLADKLSPEDIAQRHGITARKVNQSLKLGELDSSVLTAWRAGKLTAEAAEAFTLQPDKDKQADLLKSLLKQGGHALEAWRIRQAIVGNNSREIATMLKVVGHDAYTGHGGELTRDLFSDDDSTMAANPELVVQLFNNHCAAACDELKSDGWAWAEYDTAGKRFDVGKYRRITGTIGKSLRGKYGCLLHLEKDELKISTGWREIETRSSSKAEAKKPAGITMSLAADLESQRCSALRTVLARSKPTPALAELLAGIVGALIDVSPRGGSTPEPVRNRLKAMIAAAHRADMLEALHDEFDPKDYLSRVSVDQAKRALADAGIKGVPATLTTRKQLVKFAAALDKAKWLPKELRV